jgi:Outer membrane protein beta-barrel domain
LFTQSDQSIMLRVALWIACLLAISTGSALAEGGQLSLGGSAGICTPLFDHNKVDRFDVKPAGCYGGTIAYGVSEHTSLVAGWLYSIHNVRIDEGERRNMVLQDVTLGGRWAILTGQVRPLVMLGFSYMRINLDQPLDDETGLGAYGGIGMEFVITEHLRLGISQSAEYAWAPNFEKVVGLATLGFFNFVF